MPADRDPAERASARFQRAAGRRAGFAELWRWWTSELAPLVPRSTRAAVRRRRMRPVVVFEGDTATPWRPVMRGAETLMEPGAPLAVASEGAAAAGRSMIDTLRAGSSAPLRVVVALPGRQTLRRTLALPAAIEENLKQALAYDLDRHTPFKADELYFDAAVVGRDPTRAEIRVDLAAARRGIVDHAVQTVESWGGQVVAVVPEAPASASASRLNLLPDDRRAPPSAWRRWRIAVPVFVLLIAAIAGLAIPIVQKREYAIALGRQVDAARAEAATSDGLRTELERLSAEYNFALERKYAFPPTVQVLNEVTKLLPDDTWLTQMELKTSARGKDMQRELMLRGESGNAGRLITLFEESKVFTQAAPRSPTTKIQPGPGEIFDLVAQLRALPPPAPVTIALAPEGAEAGTPAALPTAGVGTSAAPRTAAPAPGTPPAAAGSPSAPAAASAPQPAPAQGAASAPQPAPGQGAASAPQGPAQGAPPPAPATGAAPPARPAPSATPAAPAAPSPSAPPASAPGPAPASAPGPAPASVPGPAPAPAGSSPPSAAGAAPPAATPPGAASSGPTPRKPSP